MQNCSNCNYFGDFTHFNLGLKCLNEHNIPEPGDFMTLTDPLSICEYYKLNNPLDRFEWDPDKNEKNKKKHGVGFEIAFDIYSDPHQLQLVEDDEKWEKIDESTFDEKGIPRNLGNLDPIRGKIIGQYGGKLFTFVYTFRHDFGNLAYRVISLRRSNKYEEEAYRSAIG
jgi:uncharacterized DUF497 family protein